MAKKAYSMNHMKSYYTYGSAARELKPQFRPDWEYEQEEKKRQKEEERIRRMERRERQVYLARLIVAIVLLFVGCVAFIGMRVVVENEERSIRLYQEELASLKNSNAILEAELTEQVDLDFVKQEAMERLGMTEPQSYQVVYIDVPKESYTVQYAASEEAQTDDGFFLSGLWEWLF